MVSNQPPPFPAFAGLGTEALDDPAGQGSGADDGVDDLADGTPGSGSAVDAAFDRLTPEAPDSADSPDPVADYEE